MIHTLVTVSPAHFFCYYLTLGGLALPILPWFSMRRDRSDLPREYSRMLRKLDDYLDSLHPTRETGCLSVALCLLEGGATESK